MGIQPLTESQEIDLILEDINKEVLNEGWWETTKYALSKLGRYKANGKILGKTQETAKSESKVRDLLMKKGNEIIQQLDKDIRGIDPEFPNNKSRVSFLRCVILVSQAYDSIVAATKLPPTDPKFLPIDAANLIITDLREYVKKFLDTDLSAAFSIMDSEIIDGNLITEDELLDEAEPRSAKLSQAGKTGKFGSTRMDTLKSNKLPLLLAGLGVSLGGLSWLMDSVWGQRFIEVPTEEEKVKYLKNTIGTIQPGQGLTQWLNMFEGTGLNPNSTPQQFLDAVTKVGNGDLDKGIEALTEQGGIFRNPDAAKQVLEQIKNNPDGYKNLGEMFKGTWAGTGKSIGDTLVTVPGASVVETIAKKVAVPVLKKVLVKTAAGSASPIIGALGIGLMAAGALVKGMRIKGQKQSRAKTLNDLYQSLVNLEPTEENPSSGIIETAGEGDATGGDQSKLGGATGVNIECVKNLIKATIQLNEMIASGVIKAPSKANMSKKNIKVGQQYLYNGKPVLVVNLDFLTSRGPDSKWLTSDDLKYKNAQQLEPNKIAVVFGKKYNDYSDVGTSTPIDIAGLKPLVGGNKLPPPPKPEENKGTGKTTNKKTNKKINPSSKNQLNTSIDRVVHNILREFIELQEAGAAWNTANAAGVTQTSTQIASKVGSKDPNILSMGTNETDAVNGWNKVVNAFKQANVSTLVKPMESLVNTSISQGKDTLKAAQEDMMQIGNLIIQNRATIGKVIPFEQLVKEAEDPKIARSRNVQAIAKAISLVSRIIMAYKEDIGLTGAYGSAKAPMNLFIQAYDCVVKGGGKSGGQTTQGGNQPSQGGNNQANQGTQGTNQQDSNQANQGGDNQPEGNGTEQSENPEQTNEKKPKKPYNPNEVSFRGSYM